MLHTMTRLSSLILFLFILTSLYAPLSAAVITVGAGGDYPEIQDAVDVAVDGDVLLIYEGTYQPVEISKLGISLVADVDAAVCIKNGLTISKLAAGKNILISNIKVDFDGAVTGIALDMYSNYGSIRFEGCRFLGSDYDSGKGSKPERGARVNGSKDVAFVDCYFEGGDGGKNSIGQIYPGKDGMNTNASIIALYRCTLVGGEGEDGPVASKGSDGGHAYYSYNTRLFASDSIFQGGDGGDGGGGYEMTSGGNGGDGGHGVCLMATYCQAYLQWCSKEGGLEGAGGLPNGYGSWPGLPGNPGEPLFIGQGYAEELGGPVRSFFAPNLVKEGDDLTLNFYGELKDVVGLLVGAGGGSQFMYNWEGQFLLSLNPAPVFFFIVPMPPGSTYMDITAPFPEMGPGITDMTIYMQALFADALGTLRLGTVQTMVGLDGAY